MKKLKIKYKIAKCNTVKFKTTHIGKWKLLTIIKNYIRVGWVKYKKYLLLFFDYR